MKVLTGGTAHGVSLVIMMYEVGQDCGGEKWGKAKGGGDRKIGGCWEPSVGKEYKLELLRKGYVKFV